MFLNKQHEVLSILKVVKFTLHGYDKTLCSLDAYTVHVRKQFNIKNCCMEGYGHGRTRLFHSTTQYLLENKRKVHRHEAWCFSLVDLVLELH